MSQLTSFKVVLCFGYPIPEVMSAAAYEDDKSAVQEVLWSGQASDSHAAFMAGMGKYAEAK